MKPTGKLKAICLLSLLYFANAAALPAPPSRPCTVTCGTASPSDTYAGRMQACLRSDGAFVVETDGKGNPLLGTAYLLAHHLCHVSGTAAEPLEAALAAVSAFLPLSDTVRDDAARPLCTLDGKALADIGLLPQNGKITALAVRVQQQGPEASAASIEFLTGKTGRSAARGALQEAEAQGGRIFQCSTYALHLKRLKDRLASSAADEPAENPAPPAAKPDCVPSGPAPRENRPAYGRPQAPAEDKPSIAFIGATTVHSPDGRITVRDTGHGFRIETHGIKPAVAVDGKLVGDSCLKDIKPDSVRSIRLLLEPEAAAAEYGETARGGVIEITTESGARR